MSEEANNKYRIFEEIILLAFLSIEILLGGWKKEETKNISKLK